MAEYFKDVGEAVVNEKGNSKCQFALHVAACNNSLPEIKRLLSKGADVNSRDEWNHTPLHEAAFCNQGDSHFDTMEMLLKSGAEVNALNRLGATPLHYLLRNSNEIKTVKLFLSFGADVNIRDSQGGIPLSKAIAYRYKNLEVYKLLLDYGSDINNLKEGRMTPLHSACIWSETKIIKFLVKNGANVNILNSERHTPLMMILKVNFKSHNWIQFLIEYTDVNAIDSEGKNVLCIPRNYECESVWKTIVKHIAKLQDLNLPVHQNIHETVSMQLEYGEYFKQCIEELKLAKSKKLKNCWVTFFNLLVDNKRRLKNYAGNQDLVQDFYETDCLKKFPLYGSVILKNMSKGVEMRKLFDQSSIILSENLPVFNPNHLIIKDVLDCLTFKDLKCFSMTKV